jgi:hypothetical protein
LYVVAKHNIFSDRPLKQQKGRIMEGNHLLPREALAYPNAREEWMWRNPWSFEVSDLELIRQKKLKAPSDTYLYALLEGELKEGALSVEVQTDRPSQRSLSGGGQGEITGFADDLWGRRKFTAIPLKQGSTEQLGDRVHGWVDFVYRKSFRPRLKLESMRFFRLLRDGLGYRSEEITHLFSCVLDGPHTRCHF